MKRSLLLTIISVVHIFYCFSQKQPFPEIGKSIDNYTFTDLQNVDKPSVSLSDYKGRWLVLDFWTNGCISCIRSFPKINKLRDQFAGQAEILMVGLYSAEFEKTSKKATKSLYELHKQKYKLKLSIAFDSASSDVFDIKSTPTILIINPDGFVVAKTGSIDSSELAQLIKGKNPKLFYAYSRHEKEKEVYNKELPLLTTGQESNGGNDTAFIFRSLLTRSQEDKIPGTYIYGWDGKLHDPNKKGMAEIIGCNLPAMLRLAHTGRDAFNYYDHGFEQFYPKPIIESGDGSVFEANYFNRTATNTYSYSLKVPRMNASGPYLRRILLQDLERYFGFSSCIAMRKVPVYRLIVTDEKKVAKLKSKGGQPGYYYNEKSREGLHFKNMPIERLANLYDFHAALFMHVKDIPPKIIDGTGIHYNIDIELNDNIEDWATVLRLLRNNGLDLRLGEIDMQCIVVTMTETR
jgi:thiol-disulfide isomerase/thioredoxin